MEPQAVPRDDLLDALPAEWPADLLPAIRDRVRAGGQKLVVLDDDPTGTQTVHGLDVLTEWPVPALAAALADERPAFYLLTNSRSLPPAEAQALNTEIGRSLAAASRHSGVPFAVVSRGDSTLRGHFPGEVEALAGALGGPFDGWLLVPFFLEGGRYTVGDVHYVEQEGRLVPAGQTAFARDSAFGYRASDLRAWVEEKTGGRVRAADVRSISLDDIRRGGPERVARRMLELSGGRVCAVNAAAYRDVEVVVQALLAAEAQGRRFIYRTAASFVRVRAGLEARPLLAPAELGLPEAGGGLIVVGSYVPATTAQVQALLHVPGLAGIEVAVDLLLSDAGRAGEIERVAGLAEQALRQRRDVLVYTSRRLVTAAGAERSLSLGSRVSDGLIAVLRRLSTRPRYLIAKGGITSSDLATRGLDVKRALVRGQILPGVPLWQLGLESRYPGLAYVVFPGNVGGPGALAQLVLDLRVKERE